MQSLAFRRVVLSFALVAMGFVSFPVRAYTGTVVPLPGFAQAGAGGAMSFARLGSAGSYVGGVFTGSSFYNAANGARAVSIGMRLTAAASATAAAAIRANPTFATAAMASYLLGIAYNVATQQWEISRGAATYYWSIEANPFGIATPGPTSALLDWAVLRAQQYGWGTCHSPTLVCRAGTCTSLPSEATVNVICSGTGANPVNAANMNRVSMASVGPPGMVAATEADWLQVAAQPLPDVVANALPATLPLPVALPEVAPQRYRIGAPYNTPVGWRQEVEDLKPLPVPGSPHQVDVQPKTVVGDDPTTTVDETPTDPSGSAEPKQITCGLPDTPACKIDEGGTPDPVEKPAVDDVDQKLLTPKRIAEGDHGGIFPTMPTISWGFALPSTCGVISLPAFAPFLTGIDLCQFQPTFHSIMGIVWVVGGLFGAIGVFWRDQLAA